MVKMVLLFIEITLSVALIVIAVFRYNGLL